MSLLPAALDYAARGWHVLPLKPKGKEPLGALVRRGFKDASTDPSCIRQWWQERPDANLGIATGAVSGIDVLDVDGELGARSLEELTRRFGELPAAIEAKTGNGRHIYFAHSAPLRCRTRFAPGLDLKACGGYVVAAPSVHENGSVYGWAPGRGPDDSGPGRWPPWLDRRDWPVSRSHQRNEPGRRLSSSGARPGSC